MCKKKCLTIEIVILDIPKEWFSSNLCKDKNHWSQTKMRLFDNIYEKVEILIKNNETQKNNQAEYINICLKEAPIDIS